MIVLYFVFKYYSSIYIYKAFFEAFVLELIENENILEHDLFMLLYINVIIIWT